MVIVNQQFIFVSMTTRCQLLLLLLLLLSGVAGQGWSQYTDIRTDRVEMIASGSSFVASTIPISYNMTYTSPLSGTQSAGLGIVGFTTLQTLDMSMNASIVDFTATYIHIDARALDTTVVTYMAVHYIAIGALSYFVEMQYVCFLPTVINVGNGTRSQTRTSISSYDYSTLACNIYLSGFRIHNSDGLLNYLLAETSCPSSSLTHTFTTTENNTVSQICYSALIFCDQCTNITYYEWGQTGQGWLSNSGNPNSVFTPDGNRYQSNSRMFWGISAVNMSRGTTRDFNFQSDYFNQGGGSNINTNYSSNTGTYGMLVSYFFIATRSCNGSNNQWFQILTHTVSCVNNNNCDNSTVQTLGGSARYCKACHYTCKQCANGALAENCTSCQNTHYRTLTPVAGGGGDTCPCDPGYIDIGISLCYTCQYYIAGCFECISTTNCSSCLSGYTLTGTNVCDCTTGYLVSGICTTVKGCINATDLGGTVYCTACNSTLNYQINSSYSCECTTAHYFDANFDCVALCGDSLLGSTQACDDGNTINGDGCNSLCQVQTYYTCSNAVMPSTCMLEANITGTVRWVQRKLNSNTAQFGIEFSLFFSNYHSMLFNTHFTTDMPCFASGITTKIDRNYLVLECPYTETVEGNTYSLSLQMDQRYFTSLSFLTATLPASGMNAKLTYDSNNNLYDFQDILIIILAAAAVTVAFVSVISERMIGVELIQCIQIVFFAMTVMDISPSSLATLQNLIYSNGYNRLKSDKNDRVYPISKSVGQIGLEHQFLMNYNLMYIILGVVIVLLLILKAVLYKFQTDLAKEQQYYHQTIGMERVHPNYSGLRKVYKFIFERIFFVLAFMGMFLIMFSVANEFTQPDPLYYVLSSSINILFALLAGVILVGFLSLILLNGIFPQLGIFPMFMDRKYPIYYTIYNLAFIVVLISFYDGTSAPFILAGMTVVNILVLICWRPYPQTIHNVTIVIEQGLILLALGVYTLEYYTAQKENRETVFTIALFVIAALILLVIVLSVIRLIMFYHFMDRNGLSYDQENVDEEEGKSLMTPKSKDMARNNSQLTRNRNRYPMAKKASALPMEDDYINNLNDSKDMTPLKSMGQDTKRECINRGQDPNKTNEEDFQTFNKNKNNNANNGNRNNNGNNGNRNNNGNNSNNGNNGSRNNGNGNSSNNGNRNTGNNGSNGNQKGNNDKSDRNNDLRRSNVSLFIDPLDPNKSSFKEHKDNSLDLSTSPYNEHGHIKKQNPSQSQEEDEADRLKIIKARLRKDFHMKLTNSAFNHVQNEPSRVDISYDNSINENPSKFSPGDLNDD